MFRKNRSILYFTKPKKTHSLKRLIVFIAVTIAYLAVCVLLVAIFPRKFPQTTTVSSKITSTVTSDAPTKSSSSYPVYSSATTGVTTQSQETEFPLDINSADAASLAAIDGIGTVLSERIVAYRNSNGAFSSVDDLLAVKGIGTATLEKIRDKLYVDGDAATQSFTSSSAKSSRSSTAAPQSSASSSAESSCFSTAIASAATSRNVEFPLNLNTASADDLAQIPGISESFAKDVVALRDKIQYFSAFEELWLIKDISGKQFDAFRKYCYID